MSMSLFEKLENVYFDMMQLGEDLSKLPTACDCPLELQRLGKCCCADSSAKVEKSQGCLMHVEEVLNEINWMEDDLRIELIGLHDKDMSLDLVSQLTAIDTSIRILKSRLKNVKEKLKQNQLHCVLEEFEKLKESSQYFKQCLAGLNMIL